MNKFLKELRVRWKAESPKFWKKIMKFSITIGTSALAVIGADQMFSLQTYGVPAIIFTICGYIITACFAFGLAAKITKQDHDHEGEHHRSRDENYPTRPDESIQ